MISIYVGMDVGIRISIDHLLLVEIESDRGRILNDCWGHWQGLAHKVHTQLIQLRVWLNHLVHLLNRGLTSTLLCALISTCGGTGLWNGSCSL